MELYSIQAWSDYMYVVCNKHLENAIEDFVETYEQPPIYMS